MDKFLMTYLLINFLLQSLLFLGYLNSDDRMVCMVVVANRFL